MSKKKENKQKLRDRITNLMDIPKEVTQDLSRVVIIGEKELVIENYKGILEYDSTIIRAKTVGRSVKVVGRNLDIGVVTDEEIQITGEIDSFEFIQNSQ